MPDWPNEFEVPPLAISTATPESVAFQLQSLQQAFASLAWPAANRACYTPFVLHNPTVARQLFVANGATVSGNIDVGIYDYGLNLIVSAGSTAQAGTSTIQLFDIADTALPAGVYYLAVALNNGTGTTLRSAIATNAARIIGIFQQATAFPLPSSATPAIYAGSMVPLAGLATSRML